MRKSNPTTKCLDGCNTPQRLVWAKNHKGSKMIFELEPHPDGKWTLTEMDDGSYEVALAGDSYDGDLYICHWDICEKRQKKDDDRPTRRGTSEQGGSSRRSAEQAPPRREATDSRLAQGRLGEIEASVIVNGVTYFGILRAVVDDGPAIQGKKSDLDEL